jgi:hypothetical protein
MEDAYVIGIRLALENGVSAGIADIAADLARLDGAIAATTAHLQQLQSLSGGIELPVPRLPQTASRTSSPETGTTLPAPESSAATATARSTDLSDARAAGAPRPAAISPPPTVRILNQTTLSAAPAPVDLPAEGKGGAAASPAGHAAAAPPVTTSAAPASPAGPPVPQPGDVRTPPIAPALAATFPPGRARQVSPPTGDAELRFRAPVSDPLLPPSPSMRSAAPPTPQATTAVQREGVPQAAVAYPSVAAAPPPRESGTAPTGGDVYLDGTRMGRWVSDRLARDAGRPPAGATGFDPRLGPAWPGPMQGE